MAPQGVDPAALDRVAHRKRYLLEHEHRIGWVMGSSRSGSTWLLRMLCEIDGVAGIDDPHLGHHLGVWRPLPLAWATASSRPRLQTLFDVKREKPDFFFSDHYREAWLPALRELIATRFGAQLADAAPADPSPTLIVKEPGSHAAETILAAFPRSRLVFLLRDGRDVVDSWLDAYRSGSWAIDGGAYPVAPEGRLALVSWLSSVWAYRTRAVADVFARLPGEQRVMIRYEDLLAETPRELDRICGVLGVDAGDETLCEIAAAHSMSRIEPEERGPLHEARVAEPGGWRLNLTLAERTAMHEVMGTELSRFGYLGSGTPAVAA